MTTQELQDRLESTTILLINAHENAAKALDAVKNSKRNLAAAETHHTLAGLEGKNEQARKAELAALTFDDHNELAYSEQHLIAMQLALTIAELNHRLARDLLRLHTRGGDDEAN